MKLDGLRRRSPPGVLTVPSATGNIQLSPFIGIKHFLCIEPSGVDF